MITHTQASQKQINSEKNKDGKLRGYAVSHHVGSIQAAMVAVRTMREADLTIEPHTRRSSPEEPHRPGQAGTMLSQAALD